MGVSLPNRRPIVLTIALVGLLLALPGAARALEDIGVVDYQAIFDRFEGTGDAQQAMDRELKEWDEELKEKRREIEELTRETESQRLMLSEDRLREKQDELTSKRSEYERFAESIYGVNGKAAQRNAELTKPIAEKILEAVERIGREKDLKIILDAGTGGVVWAEDDVNITQIVLDDLSSSVTGLTDVPIEDEGEGQ